MIVEFRDQIERLKDLRSGKLREGLRLDIPEIDEHFRFKYRNFNVILGHANVGKTTVILYKMILYSLKHKVKWLVYSSENEPYHIIRKLLEFLEVKPFNKITNDDFKNKSEWIYDHFKFIDNNLLYTYKDLVRLAKNVKKQWDFQGFMIDPYNSLVKCPDELNKVNGNTHEYDYKATSELRMFCKAYNTTIWLCTHANTNALRNKHTGSHPYAFYPMPPLAADVEGGGKFVNRADDFLVIHRYIQHPSDWMISHIHVRKIKDTDTGGRPTSVDEPIKLRSVLNNVGFEIGGENPIHKKDEFSIKELPF